MGATDPSAYMTNAKVYQLGRGSSKASQDNNGGSNAVLKEYEFVDIFPTAISAIAKKVKLAEELFSMPPSSKLLLKNLLIEVIDESLNLIKKSENIDYKIKDKNILDYLMNSLQSWLKL